MKILILLLVMSGVYSASSQRQYQVDINKDQYKLYTGHLHVGNHVAPSGDSLSYTNFFLTKNGKPWIPVMGELHYSRLPKAKWEESILKMKSAGITVIASYIFWIQSEQEEGKFSWKGCNDLREFVTLCKKHGLFVWLRIGPWCHGEIRNGGFPDWLLKKGIGVRKNDYEYLKNVKRLYNEIAGQVNGYYYKQGGNIIGIQLENELAYKDKDNYNHMLTLKSMAVEAGIDVPYYSAFAQGPIDQNDFLSPIGGYPDSPWRQDTKKLIKSAFFFSPLENDKEIGADLFGQIDTKVHNKYPSLSAELGGGMQVTYHRRTKVKWEDVLSIAYTRLGSGLNGLGYYMFHGGINPIGDNSTLQESRSTGYPNDVPLINYDFQAPIGAMNDLKPSYYEYKLLHAFVNDFGELLAPRPAFFPRQRVQSSSSADTVRVAVRAMNNSGFIFMSNYQRHVDMKAVNDFQLSINYGDEILKVPRKPFCFPGNSMMIWPFNMEIEGSKLIYSTAQLLYKIQTNNKPLYVFWGNEDAELVFDKESIEAAQGSTEFSPIEALNNKLTAIAKQPGKKCLLHIKSCKGKEYDILVLNKEQALHSWKFKEGNTDHLILSDADLFIDDHMFVLQKVNTPAIYLSVYPTLKLSVQNGWKMNDKDSEGFFTGYSFYTNEVNAKASFQEETSKLPDYLLYSNSTFQRLKKDFPVPFDGATKIWNTISKEQSYFRKNFTLETDSDFKGYLAFTPDDEAKVYCNGALLNVFNADNNLTLLNITNYLHPGKNNISVKLKNLNGKGGLLARLVIVKDDIFKTYPSDTTWKISTVYSKGWNQTKFDDNFWQKPVPVALGRIPIIWDQPQPGPLYGKDYSHSTDAKSYKLVFSSIKDKSVGDLFLKIGYRGDMAALYKNGRLVYDDFYYGEDNLTVSLNSLGIRKKDKTQIQLFHVKPYYDIYVEDEIRRLFNEGRKQAINKIKLDILYEVKIKVK